MMMRIEAGEMIEPQDCKTVLVVISLAFRPLSISELSALADLLLDIAETAVEMCGSFLTVVKGTVNLIHQSAKDYLEKNYRVMDFCNGCNDISILIPLLEGPGSHVRFILCTFRY